jgi:hypothetical protein
MTGTLINITTIQTMRSHPRPSLMRLHRMAAGLFGNFLPALGVAPLIVAILSKPEIG